MVFISSPATGSASRTIGTWYDILLAVCTAGLFGCFAVHAERIVLEAWEYAAPQFGMCMAKATGALVLEAGRRAGGWPIFVVHPNQIQD